MCEQTPIDYKEGDIVWVKLGPCWWPGEVREFSKLPLEWRADFRKPPIATVKFFDEDAYEYVKSIDKIYSYNCTKKNEFIRKGLDLYRAKNSFMDKFPADVSTAETRTDGDPNIIDSPLFTAEKKINFAALLFGSPKPKKTPKKSGVGKRPYSSTTPSPSTSSRSTSSKTITHPRFLGQDDHEVRILVQSSERSEVEERTESEAIYNCTSCGFTTTRIDVIVLHNKSHIQGVYSTPTTTVKKGKKSSPAKRGKKVLKMTRSKTSSIVEDLALIERGLLMSTESSDEENAEEDWDSEPKRKRKKNKRKSKKAQPKTAEQQENKVDIRDNLLAEWEDDSEEQEDVNLNTSSTAESDTSISKIEESNKTDNKPNEVKKDADKSCFDFEEEEDNEIIGTSVGRKIPRVIPPADRQKTVDPDVSEADLPIAEDDVNRNEQIKEVNDVVKEIALDVVEEAEAEVDQEKTEGPDEGAFKDILDSTAVPDLPEIPHSLKYEQNFHNAKTIKFPDKPLGESSADEKSKSEMKESPEVAAAKLINPKKRFVKSFEDFEQQWNNEQKKMADCEKQTVVESKATKVEDQQNNMQVEHTTKVDDQVNCEGDKVNEPDQPLKSNLELLESESQLTTEKETVKTDQRSEKVPGVEVSKLKTQLMSKLESADRLLPLEQSRNKQLETPRHSRSLRQRALDKQNEDTIDDSWVNKKIITYKSHRTDLLSPKSKQLQSERAKSPCEASTCEVSEMQEVKGQAVDTEKLENSAHMNIFEDINTETKIKSRSKLSSAKSRRLSIKMPEIEETHEIDHTAELLELEQTVMFEVEQVKVLEVHASTGVPQVERIVTEVPKTETQIVNAAQICLQNSDLLDSKKVTTEDKLKESDLENISERANEGSTEIIPKLTPLVEKNETNIHSETVVESIDTNISITSAQPNTESTTPMEVDKEVKDVIYPHLTNDTEKTVNSNIDTFDTTPSEKVDYTSPNFRVESTTSEDLSALSTLAAVSELTINFDIQGSSHDEKSKIIEGNLVTIPDVPSTDLNSSCSEKSKLNEGNLTFVTEDDLADGQVEIADISNVDKHKIKPITLSSFSVDFTDPTQGASLSNDTPVSSESIETTQATNIVFKTNKRKHSQDIEQSEIIEKSLEKVFEGDTYLTKIVPTPKSLKTGKIESKTMLNTEDENCDIEDQIPSLVVCSSKQPEGNSVFSKASYYEKSIESPEYTSSSKLLEILTDGKPKSTKMEPITSQKLSNALDTQPNSKADSRLSPAVSKDTKGISKFDTKNSKFVIKSAISGKTNAAPAKINKPIILSEKIIKPLCETESVSVQKVTSKRNNQDIEDIDTFIIQKPAKKMMISQEVDVSESLPVLGQTIKKPSIPRGKAKILQQTIIKPAGEPTTTFSAGITTVSQTNVDDNMFDINSMPIVLGDQILTAETIENLPVVLPDAAQSTKSTAAGKSQTDKIKLLNKTAAVTTQSMLVKTYSSQKLGKSPRLLQSSTTKVVKSNPAIITCTGKSDKFIIVPSGSHTPTASKYTVGKRPPIVKRSSPVILPTPASATKVQTSLGSEPSGNKIMIVTNQQGHQSRVLLTPAQQKLIGYQSTGSKLVKNTLKGNILQKTSNIKSSGLSSLTSVSPKVPSMISRAIVNSKGELISTSSQNLITSDGQVLMPVKTQQIRTIKSETAKGGKKIQMQSQKVLLQDGLNALKGSSIPGQQKTIVIKNQQGQIVKKFQGTDDALLEQQVAEQVQAIKASGSFSSLKARQDGGISKFKPAIRRSYPKKSTSVEATRSTNKAQTILNTSVGFISPKLQKSETSVPPLAPISPKRSDTLLLSQSVPKTDDNKVDVTSVLKDITKAEQIQQKPLNQLIIQDALGNQTTITEGQILALPSGETVGGQPQSYMLVTLDESGNLAPLDNEALLSLDPNLCLGGDLSNMVLQIDEGTVTAKHDGTGTVKTSESTVTTAGVKEALTSQNSDPVQKESQQSNVMIPTSTPEQLEEKSVIPENTIVGDASSALLAGAESVDAAQQNVEGVHAVACSIGSNPNQLIITGDPITAQKLIESLAEGNADFANLLASAEGNILIQTDEQQILINTDTENQVLMPVNENMGVIETSEGDGNPIFATQPTKNQDILAAALADTDVFQQEQTISPVQTKVSQLSPSSGMYPSGVGNVLETTLSLSSPIMTPLEVPSSNNKKIPDEESDILTTEVPKNVDLPITITDPNISQTVAQQQVATLIANELSSNLDLPLTISDQVVPLTSTEMNSPSYVYSLPSLDEAVDIHPKTFSGPISMPLLNIEPQETATSDANINDIDSKPEIAEDVTVEKEVASNISGIDAEPTSCSSNIQDSSSVDQVNTIFETSALTASSIKDDENLQSGSRSFLGTIETEEGLCTLGGAMCSSLSEPPPDMFDLSVVNSNYGSESTIKEHTVVSIPEESVASDVSENTENTVLSCQSKPIDNNLGVTLSVNEPTTNMDDYDKYESYDNESRNDSTPLSNLPLNSESSSPAVNIDENSCEIPVQPQIVTDLSSSSFDTHETTDSLDFDSNKRSSADDNVENEKKKIKFD